jgi:DNA-binding response OmpR family regulator
VIEAASNIAPETVVVMLTAHGSLESAITAMRRGAFDYLLKPCEPRALIAGVERGLAKRAEFMRRQSLVGLMEQTVSALKSDRPAPAPAAAATAPTVSEGILHAGGLTIDTKKRQAFVGERALALSPAEHNLLTYFVRNADRAIACAELVRECLGYECAEHEARPVIRAHVHRLRQKIELDASAPQKLVTVRAAGYMLVVE